MFKILLPKNISFFTGCNISYNIGLSLYVMISVFLSFRIWQIYDQEIFEGFTCFNFLKLTCKDCKYFRGKFNVFQFSYIIVVLDV